MADGIIIGLGIAALVAIRQTEIFCPEIDFLCPRIPILKRTDAPTSMPSLSPIISPSSFPTSMRLFQQQGGDIFGELTNEQLGLSTDLSSNGERIVVGGFGLFHIYDLKGSRWTYPADLSGSFTSFVTDCAISADGNHVIAGETAANIVGRALVFEYGEDDNKRIGWSLKGTVLTDNIVGDEFGHSVDISNNGDKVIIGAPKTSSVTIAVYDRGKSNRWRIARIENTSPGFGSAVSMTGNGKLAAIGTVDGNDGVVTIFEINDLISTDIITFSQDIIENMSVSGFGGQVALAKDGTTMVVGTDIGKTAVIFVLTEQEGWGMFNFMTSTETSSNFGQSVDVSDSGTRFIVGDKERKTATVFTINENVEALESFDSVAVGDFGASVSISGDGRVFAVGGPGTRVGGVNSAGQASVFEAVESYSPSYSAVPSLSPTISSIPSLQPVPVN